MREKDLLIEQKTDMLTTQDKKIKDLEKMLQDLKIKQQKTESQVAAAQSTSAKPDQHLARLN